MSPRMLGRETIGLGGGKVRLAVFCTITSSPLRKRITSVLQSSSLL